jgi:hypothetical protein
MNRNAFAVTFLFLALVLTLFEVQLAGVSRANPNIISDPVGSPPPAMIPPVLSILSPKNNTVYNSHFITFTFNVTIPDSNVVGYTPAWWVSYAADWEEGTILVHQQKFDGDEQSFKEFSINLPDIPEGNHSVELSARIVIESRHHVGVETSQASVNFAVDSTPPLISNLSIKNETYDSGELPLNFTADGEISQASYSLDNQANETINGNTTIQGLTDGSHNLRIYAIDAAGNTGCSETVTFTVAKPDTFPTVPTAAASITAIAIVSTCLLVYFKKRKR